MKKAKDDVSTECKQANSFSDTLYTFIRSQMNISFQRLNYNKTNKDDMMQNQKKKKIIITTKMK